MGRAGRDGQPSRATLYYNASDIARNIAGMSDEVREFCRLQTCRRDFLARHFGNTVDRDSTLPAHNCCDICAPTCPCQNCQVATGEVIESEPSALQELLLQYFAAERESGVDNLTDELAREIASTSVGNSVCADELVRKYGITNTCALNILAIMSTQ